MKHLIIILLLSSCKMYTQKQLDAKIEYERNNARLTEKLRWMDYYNDSISPKIFETMVNYKLRNISADSAFNKMMILAQDNTPFYK